MKLTPYGEILKEALALELVKEGHTLQDFEDALSRLNTAEGAIKVAAMENNMANEFARPAVGFAQGLPGMALNLSGAAGAAAGLGFDSLDSDVSELNKSLAREREKVTMIRNLTHKLRQEHGLHHQN